MSEFMHREKGRRGRLAAASVANFVVSIINQGTLGRVMASDQQLQVAMWF